MTRTASISHPTAVTSSRSFQPAGTIGWRRRIARRWSFTSSTSRYYYDENGQSFDVLPDGSRFLRIKAPPRASIEVVLGWWSETAPKLAQVKR